MSANRWKYFRWTPRTAWITFVYVVAVPSVVGYVGYVTDVSGMAPPSLCEKRDWDMRDGAMIGCGEREREIVKKEISLRERITKDSC